MVADDLPAAEAITDQAFLALDRSTRRVGSREPQGRTEEARTTWLASAGHLLHHDPAGCWVATSGERRLGVALSIRRDHTWILASYAVSLAAQGHGVGKALLDAAGQHSAGCLRAMISASEDQDAVRRYRAAGFRLHPMMELTGKVDRGAFPVSDHVREGGAEDLDLLDSLDRRVRDAARRVDHEFLLGQRRLLVRDHHTGQGYAWAAPDGTVVMLAATDRRGATALLWECLAGGVAEGSPTVGRITSENEWALDVGLAAGLRLELSGYLALRGMAPPAPYLPSGHFL